MLRSSSLLVFTVLALTLAATAHSAVNVFQDPTDTGTPAAAPANITVGGPAVSLNLWYSTGNVASAPNAQCLSGTGDEVCGWDIHIATNSPSVVLQSFTPTTGSDTVFAISGNVLRANGGDPINGELSAHRIGTLVVSATAPGIVTVSGNLYVTAALAAANVTTGNILAVTGVPDDQDGDGAPDASDNCPTIANATQDDGDGDAVGDICDNCTEIANPRVAADFVTINTWATLTGGQRDDDHDGYGNKCDAKFTTGGLPAVGTVDLTQFRASNGKSRATDTCGTSGVRPCAIFDLDEGALPAIGTGDLTRFRALNGKLPGPKCATCPLTCLPGADATCGALPQ